MAHVPQVARQLLDAIAGGESAGAYDVIYGGDRFSDFSDHPRQYKTITSGPNKGQKSSAAGKYQFLGSTWDDQRAKLGLADFSPESQDAAAWNLARETYAQKTGRDLQADLEAGDTSRVASALKGQWTSLPGGIEQGVTADQFSQAYGAGGMPSQTVGNALGGGNALSASVAPQTVFDPSQPLYAQVPMARPLVKFEPLALPLRRRA